MCDYSLEGLPNRLAAMEEQLVVHRFRTGSVGMASVCDIAEANRPRPQTCNSGGLWAAIKGWFSPETEASVPAVCIPPGARLRMSRVPEQIQRSHGVRAVEDVTFMQLSADAYSFRDAIRFDNGCTIVLQTLAVGIPFEVLSLDIDEREPEAASFSKRAARSW